MGLPGSRVASPCGSSARYFWPSTVFSRIAAPVVSPSHAPFTRNEISTRSPRSFMSETRPTLTPAIRTSLPWNSPAASLNSAE